MVLVVLFFGSIAAFVIGADLRDYLFPEPFDQECWQRFEADELNAGCSRWAMRHSLSREHDLVGMSRSEVVSLLGPTGNGRVVTYYMGMANHGINTGALELRFDGSDTVESYEFREG